MTFVGTSGSHCCLLASLCLPPFLFSAPLTLQTPASFFTRLLLIVLFLHPALGLCYTFFYTSLFLHTLFFPIPQAFLLHLWQLQEVPPVHPPAEVILFSSLDHPAVFIYVFLPCLQTAESTRPLILSSPAECIKLLKGCSLSAPSDAAGPQWCTPYSPYLVKGENVMPLYCGRNKLLLSTHLLVIQ